MKKARMTGITEQDGRYLAKHLLALSYQVRGLMVQQLAPDFYVVASGETHTIVQNKALTRLLLTWIVTA
ncbi:MAG: hypothetical protein ABJB61_09580 [bacterium]